jgi:hypothetical protein
VPHVGEEARNFVDHIATALSATAQNVAWLELIRAKKHIHYANHICLLLPITQEIAAAKAGLDALEHLTGQPANDFREAIAKIERAKDKIEPYDFVRREPEDNSAEALAATIRETQQDIIDLIAKNDKLGALAARIGEELRDKHPYRDPSLMLMSGTARFSRVLSWLRHNLLKVLIVGFGGAFLIHLIGSATYERYIQKYIVDWRDNASQITKPPVSPPAPPATSNPSPSSTTNSNPPPAANPVIPNSPHAGQNETPAPPAPVPVVPNEPPAAPTTPNPVEH